jgi:hypothetical protein
MKKNLQLIRFITFSLSNHRFFIRFIELNLVNLCVKFMICLNYYK